MTQVTGRNIRVLLTEVEPITFWLLAQMPYLSKAIKLGSRLFRVGGHRKALCNQRRRREPLGGLGACILHQKFFIFRGLEMPCPIISKGKFHKSKHEKTLTIQ